MFNTVIPELFRIVIFLLKKKNKSCKYWYVYVYRRVHVSTNNFAIATFVCVSFH